MKSKIKVKIIFSIILGINFAFLTIIDNNPVVSSANINKSSVNNDNIILDGINLEISQVSSKIQIIGNSGWLAYKNAGNCTGEGTRSDPYIIEDLEIDGKYSGDCIHIENSSVYFKIQNCQIYNSEDWYTGIFLVNVTNAQLISNNFRSNWVGIALWLCYNNTITTNNVSINRHGMGLVESTNNTISGNIVNYNQIYGILLIESNWNNILGNTLNYNDYYAISLENSDNNTVSKNIAKNSIRGVNIETSVYNNFYLNCFSQNTLNSFDDGNDNQWDNGVEGNYWDDYSGVDTDSNGIGDVPYNISGSAESKDNFPLMKCPFSVQELIPGFNLIFLIGFILISLILICKKTQKLRNTN